MWWLLACQTPTTDWESSYRNSPSQVILDLQQIDDSTERLAVIESLQQAFPGQTEELCSVLPKTPQEYCIERNKRPHLWMPLKESVQSSENTTGGESVSLESACGDVACRIKEALESARRGQIEKVEQLCALSSIKEQHECLFATAEKLVSTGGVQHYNTGVEICRLAISFSTNCQNHLIQQLARHAPDADTKSDWHAIFTAHRAIQTTWGWRDESVQSQFQHRLWSEALGVSYAGADQIVGNPLDVVPKEYHCHVFSAAAWRLFQIEEPVKHTLEEWRKHLDSRLQKRSTKQEAIDLQRKFRAASNLWSSSEGLDTLDVVPYLSTSFRLRSSSESNELTIAILEAVARQPPVVRTLLETGIESEDDLIAQTAQRLLMGLPSED